MQKLQKTVNSYLNTAILYSVFMIALGVIFLVFPESSLEIIRWTLSIGLMALGALRYLGDLVRKNSTSSGTISGILLFAMGLVIVLYPNVLDIIPVVLGIWMIISSLFSLRFATAMRNTSGFFVSAVMPVITLACGILLIAHPGAGSIALMVYIGIMLIIYAVASLVNLVILRSHIDTLSKYFNKKVKVIDLKVKEDK